jgi:trans-aconitate methyltransferase
MDRAQGEPGRMAVDLGCGDGTETLQLLATGWRVLAVDQETDAIDRLVGRVPPVDRSRLTTKMAGFASVQLPAADLIYSGVSLFFCPPVDFSVAWSRIRTSVRSGGYLGAHFLGERDTWADFPEMTHHDAQSTRDLFAGWDVEEFVEVEHDRPAVSGPKHWHLFEVIARKR